MKIFFFKRQFKWPDYLEGEGVPVKFTFATSQRDLPPRGSLLIIEDLQEGAYYLAKIKSKRKITTFEYCISCSEVSEIEFSLNEVINLLHLRQDRFEEEEKIILISENSAKIAKLKRYLEENNGNLDRYFREKIRVRNSASLGAEVQAIDALATAFDIFGLGPQEYTNLTEEQIMDWEISGMSPFLELTPDGKHFIEKNGRRLYIQKVHNTPVEKCLGVDMIYNFLDEGRIVFIQYKCLNYNDKKFYMSKDAHLKIELKKMLNFDFVKNCQNFKSNGIENMRTCGCPFFVKLCSRNIPDHREEPYGFYYAICVWACLTKQPKPYIDYDDEPKISNQLFKELIHLGLIGTIKDHAYVVNDKLLKEVDNERLTLIFTEQKSRRDK